MKGGISEIQHGGQEWPFFCSLVCVRLCRFSALERLAVSFLYFDKSELNFLRVSFISQPTTKVKYKTLLRPSE